VQDNQNPSKSNGQQRFVVFLISALQSKNTQLRSMEGDKGIHLMLRINLQNRAVWESMSGADQTAMSRWISWNGAGRSIPSRHAHRIRLMTSESDGDCRLHDIIRTFDALYAGNAPSVSTPLFVPRFTFAGWSPLYVTRQNSGRSLIASSQRALVEGKLTRTDLPSLTSVPLKDFHQQLLACETVAEVSALLKDAGIADPLATEHVRNVWLSMHFNYPSWRDQFSDDVTLRCVRLLHAAINRLPSHSTDIPIAFQLLQKLHIQGNLPLHDAINAAHLARHAGFDETLAFETVSKLLLTSPDFQLFHGIDSAQQHAAAHPRFLAATVHFLRSYYERLGRAIPMVDMDISTSNADVKIATLKLGKEIHSWPAAVHAEQAGDALEGLRGKNPDESDALNLLMLSLYDMALGACPKQHLAGEFSSRVMKKIQGILSGNGDASPPDGDTNGGSLNTPHASHHAHPGGSTSSTAPAANHIIPFNANASTHMQMDAALMSSAAWFAGNGIPLC
jgi:hypothetical protein